MKKNLSATFSIVLAALFALVGCTGQTPPDNIGLTVFDKPLYDWTQANGTTLTIWGDASDLSRPYMENTFRRYQELTGGKLNIIALTKHEMDEKLPVVLRSGSPDAPDIIMGHGGTSAQYLGASENFYDFIDAPWIDDVTATAIDQTICDGRVIGLPFGEGSISGTLYNKEIFDRLDLSIPTTQDEFLLVCETLLQNGITPVYLPYAEITMLLYQFPMDTITKNTQTLNALNSEALSYSEIPEMKKIVEWYKTMSDRGYFGEDYLSNNWDGMDTAMRDGKYAMMLCWDTWLYTNFTGDPSQFGLMPAFVGVPEEGTFEGPNLLLFIVNQKSPNLDAALNMITFASDPYNYNMVWEGIYTTPVFKNQAGSISTPQYIESELLIERLFHTSTTWLRLRGFSQIDAEFIQRHMREKDYTAEDCLRDMDGARVNRLANMTGNGG